METTATPPPMQFKFLGGDIAIDFCNTVAGERGKKFREYLYEPSQFLNWAQQAGLIDEEHAQRARTRFAAHPDAGRGLLNRAIRLREAIFGLLTACSKGKEPSAEQLETLNNELAHSLHRLRLTPGRGTKEDGQPRHECDFHWHWTATDQEPAHTLGPIAHAAATLLMRPHELQKLRICQGNDCGWIFLDQSRNHSRCWCDMSDCGNRAKIRRHRQKHRSATG